MRCLGLSSLLNGRDQLDLSAAISLLRAALIADRSPEVQQTCALALCDLALLRLDTCDSSFMR